MEARFRLLEVRDGIVHMAEVGVRAEVAGRDEILLSANMFAWRREAYGPNAVMQLNGDDALIREAIDGVQDGLDRVGREHGSGYRATITTIHESVIDTSAGDVRAAARQALYTALGVQPEPAQRGKVIQPED